jgi:UDP-N-acetylmuramoylalanine--D-glutamate ligase
MKMYKTALILGYGRSGRAAERMLRSEGTETRVISRETVDDAGVTQLLKDCAFEVCVVSPGFALSHPWLCAVRSAGIPLLSELELGWSRHQGKTIAVTGSNGKSTAVKWICESLQETGQHAVIGGNYGVPACEVVLQHPEADWLVLEVSSFQLETAVHLRADVALVLNILPNHLDRHGCMDIYWQTKARLFKSAVSADACLVPFDWLGRFRKETGGEGRWITFGDSAAAGYRFCDGKVYRGAEAVLDLAGTLFDSPVIGGCTGAAVAAVADAAGIPMRAVESAAKQFVPLPHRMQKLAEINGVTFINDSKATNLAALAAAVCAVGAGVHLIAGGLPKESDYTFIKEILAERVRSIYLVGQASRPMYQAWNRACLCVECGSLEKAFAAAIKVAKAGETILLSPGCASFDQFCSFEERGERFGACVEDVVHAGKDAI